jgi:hypothetical protein
MWAYFRSSGIRADPTTVTLKVRDPDGIITTVTGTTRNQTGDYYYDWNTMNKVGQWWGRYEGYWPGGRECHEEWMIIVDTSRFD